MAHVRQNKPAPRQKEGREGRGGTRRMQTRQTRHRKNSPKWDSNGGRSAIRSAACVQVDAVGIGRQEIKLGLVESSWQRWERADGWVLARAAGASGKRSSRRWYRHGVRSTAGADGANGPAGTAGQGTNEAAADSNAGWLNVERELELELELGLVPVLVLVERVTRRDRRQATGDRRPT